MPKKPVEVKGEVEYNKINVAIFTEDVKEYVKRRNVLKENV